ncbi:MAG: hypothetical protein H6850_00855 [Alphaproteobacteria bacterium]|nr:MAG: hypothetical protein H6850_00855 [Alphaproteobacteria bacterium]
MFLYLYADFAIEPEGAYYEDLMDKGVISERVPVDIAKGLVQSQELENGKIIVTEKAKAEAICFQLESDSNLELTDFSKEVLAEIEKLKSSAKFYTSLSTSDRAWFNVRLKFAINSDKEPKELLSEFSKDELDELQDRKGQLKFYNASSFNSKKADFDDVLTKTIEAKMKDVLSQSKDEIEKDLHTYSLRTLEGIKNKRKGEDFYKNISSDEEKIKFDKKLQKAIFMKMKKDVIKKSDGSGDVDSDAERDLIHNLGFVFENQTDFADVILPFITQERYDAVLARVAESLKSDTIQEDDRRFLAFMQIKNGAKLESVKEGYFVLDVPWDGTCVWHSLLRHAPELLKTLELSNSEVMDYIKGGYTVSSVNTAKEAFAKKVEKLTSADKAYQQNGVIWEVTKITSILVQFYLAAKYHKSSYSGLPYKMDEIRDYAKDNIDENSIIIRVALENLYKAIKNQQGQSATPLPTPNEMRAYVKANITVHSSTIETSLQDIYLAIAEHKALPSDTVLKQYIKTNIKEDSPKIKENLQLLELVIQTKIGSASGTSGDFGKIRDYIVANIDTADSPEIKEASEELYFSIQDQMGKRRKDLFPPYNEDEVKKYVADHIKNPGDWTEVRSFILLVAFILKVKVSTVELRATSKQEHVVSFKTDDKDVTYPKIFLHSNGYHAQQFSALPKTLKD